MPIASLDVIVIGTGEAARPVAYTCRKAGRSVAVIDSLPFGGTCELRGCDPKKVLVGVSELIDWSRRMQGKGASAPAMSVDWSDLIRFKRTFTDPVPHENEQSFEEAGITAYHGRAHFVDRISLEVDGERLIGRSVVIATGARPATLGIPGEELLTTSTQFLELDQFPRRVAFVGGGYIAFEFAHIAARAVPRSTCFIAATVHSNSSTRTWSRCWPKPPESSTSRFACKPKSRLSNVRQMAC